MVKKIQVNLSNKLFYSLVAVAAIVVLGVGVYAYIGNVGHPSSQIDEVDPSVNSYVKDKGSCVAITGGSGLCDGVDDNGFGPPNYDSGWLSLSQGEDRTLTHNLGGNLDNYLVDFQCKNPNGPHNYYVGLEVIDYTGPFWGGAWHQLSTTSVKVARERNDPYCPQARLRIWTY